AGPSRCASIAIYGADLAQIERSYLSSFCKAKDNPCRAYWLVQEDPGSNKKEDNDLSNCFGCDNHNRALCRDHHRLHQATRMVKMRMGVRSRTKDARRCRKFSAESR